MSNLTAKAAPEFLKDSVIYQINLRTFTPDGTLRAAERLLPHIAALGADMVYLCPVTLADDDPRRNSGATARSSPGSTTRRTSTASATTTRSIPNTARMTT